MYISPNREDVQKIVVLNAKGGCGKTTLATNLASYFALRGPLPTLLDCDPHGYSMRWLDKRSPERPPIHGIAAYKNSMQATRTWQLRVPRETTRLIVDTPAGIDSPAIHDLTYGASSILIPILPSPIDIRFAARFIAELLLMTQVDRRDRQIGVVANRTRHNTRSLRQLMRFLTSLRIPIIASLRNSQNYVHCAGEGIGIYEMPYNKARTDIQHMSAIVHWLDRHNPSQEEPASVTQTELFPEPITEPLQ